MLAWDFSSFFEISTSTHSVFFSSLVKAIFKTSSAVSTGILESKMEINLKNGIVVQSDNLGLLKYKCELN